MKKTGVALVFTSGTILLNSSSWRAFLGQDLNIKPEPRTPKPKKNETLNSKL
jgi:hypothetical protein